MSPVIDRVRRQLVIALDDTDMLAQNVALGRHNQSVRTDPQADRPVREGRRNTVAVVLKADQTGRRYALAQLDEAVKGDRQRHQRGLFFSPDIRDCSPPRTAKSSLQSNWKASPGAKWSGTKVPRPVVCCSRWRSAFHCRAKAATRA